MELNNKKVINAWGMYDWANSVYNLVITSTIFPVYYNSVTKAISNNDIISFFGFEITNTVLYSYSLSFSFLLIALLSPLLSGIADYSGKKKQFMMFFTYLGGVSCISLFFFKGENVEFGIICSVLASIGYSGALVFYNAFLPEIASNEKADIVSARGYAMGYIGSVILLIINLVMLSKPSMFGFSDEGQAARASFIMVGVWWIGFAQIPFYFLPENIYRKNPKGQYIKKGYQELKKVWHSLKELKVLQRFLISFFFYSTGVQTIMLMAATFGNIELNLPGDQLILIVLIIQVVAIFGSYFFAKLSQLRGNIFSLSVLVFVWILICIAAYFIQNVYQFFALAFIVGLVMGGIQALSRSTYSKIIPDNAIAHASYFSFYDVLEKFSIVLGTFSYGLIQQLTGSMRTSPLFLALFFVAGMCFLFLVKIPKSQDQVKINA
ncbi:MAG: MFS transporter [Bacteroidota bacterium]|nr:MFS transporter [Bacteroidota bacterium]